MRIWRPRRPGNYAQQTYDNPYWLVRYPHRRRFETAAELLLADRPTVRFDYGAGDGEKLARLFEDSRAGSVALAVAYDPTPWQLRKARQRLARWSDRARVVSDLAQAESAPGGQASDTIACLGVLEHLSWRERQRFYAFCSEHLVEGGLCLIDVPVEIGPALLAKEFGRRVLKGRPGAYRSRCNS